MLRGFAVQSLQMRMLQACCRHAAGNAVSQACHAAPAVQDLALGPLATSFALLRLPRMPEIKHGGRGLPGFTPSEIDPDTGQSASQQLCGPTHP